MNTSKDNKALMIALVMLAIFLVFFVSYIGVNEQTDFTNFWTCATEGYFNNDQYYACAAYPPLLISILKFFSTRMQIFQQFVMFMFAFILPLILYKISKEPITVWLYFSTSSFINFALTSGTLAQVFAYMLILCMYFTSNKVRLCILLLSLVSHSSAFYVAMIFFALMIIEENKDAILSRLSGLKEKAVLACSPFWGQVPEALDQKVITQTTNEGYIRINTMLSVVSKKTPLFFLIPSVMALIRNRSISMLGLMAFFFASGFLVHNRAFDFAALPMVVGLSWYYRDSGQKMKWLIIITSIIFFAFNIEQMIMLGVNC